MSYDRALEKAMRYCSFQERSIFDLKKRFFAWNVKRSEWDKLIAYLIDENFLNETRFIEAYVRGKFKMKKLGRKKIVLGLMQKKISGKEVKDVIDTEIEEEEYLTTIKELIEKKRIN